MTNATKERQLPNFQEYQYGALAARLASSKDTAAYVPSALEVLAGEKGLNLGDKAKGFIAGANASPKGIETAINIYNSMFEEKRAEYKPSELVSSWYAPVLATADEADRTKIVAKLGEYDETYGSIMKKYMGAAHIIEGKEKGIEYPDDEVSNARKVLEKYNDAIEIMQTLDRYTFEGLRPEVVNTSKKKDLKGLASRL